MNMLVSTAIAGALVPNQAAAAAPVERPDRRALEAYAAWLHFERRMLCQELWPEMGSASRWVVFAENAGFHWHADSDGKPQPSARAGAVLDLVGVDWRRDEVKPEPAPAKWRDLDSGLQQALADLVAADAALADLIKAFGNDLENDVDDRDDYREVEARRNEAIASLIECPARCIEGLQAKASALRLKAMIEDYAQHQQIAVSLADDLVRLGPAAMESQSATARVQAQIAG
jgi:hypothetical protein